MSEEYSENFSIILWKLQQYQRIIRVWDRHLDPYEFKVVMQIFDRTIGWSTDEATFRPYVMLNGDRMYAGFGKTISRSKLMKVLAGLERRGVIARRPDPYRPGLKSYWFNLEWQPDGLHDQAIPVSSDWDEPVALCDVSDGDRAVSQRDRAVSTGENEVSAGDPEETYQDNTILTGNRNKAIGVDPRLPASDRRAPQVRRSRASGGETGPSEPVPAINPPRRQRRA